MTKRVRANAILHIHEENEKNWAPFTGTAEMPTTSEFHVKSYVSLLSINVNI